MRLGLAVCVLLGAAPGFAAPRVAVHPLIVWGGDARAADQSRIDYLVEAGIQPIQMVPRAKVAEVLAAQPTGECPADKEGCLENLCRETGATYALVTTLMLDGENFVLKAKVIAVTGTFVKTIDSMSIKKDLFSPRAPQVIAAFKKLFTQLDLGSLPDQLPAKVAAVPEKKVEPETKSEPVVTPEPSLSPEPVTAAPVEVAEVHESRGTPPLRVAGMVTGAVALIAAGVATGYAFKAMADGDSLRPSLKMNGGFLKDAAEAARAKSIDSNTTLSAGLFVGAGVAAVASVVMLVASMGDSDSSVSIAPVVGGAVVGLSGTF
jgi:hypothetical protein